MGSRLEESFIDYQGDEAQCPEPLTWKQIEPGLPRPGLAGSLDPEAFAEGFVLELLQGPSKVLRWPGCWEEAPNRARVWGTDDAEWDLICKKLLQLRRLEKPEDVFHSAEGVAVTYGAFGVVRHGEIKGPQSVAVVRVIVNLVLTNAAQIFVGGDTEGLHF